MTDSNRGVKVIYFDNGSGNNSERSRSSRLRQARNSFKKSSSKRFSVKLSTEQNNRTEEAQFYGPYAHMRKKLDYTYHHYYRKERQWLHDSIIEEYLNHNYHPDLNSNKVSNTTADDFATVSTANTTAAHPDKPWFIYTAGAKGAGKRHVINKLMKEGKLPLLSVVFIDAVEIRQSLPEYSSYVEKNPKLVSKRMNKEAGYISELLILVALQAGKNVVLDGKLKHTEWYTKMFRWLRKEFQCLKLALLHVDAPMDLILQRGKARALETGMDVSLEEVEEVLESLPQSIEDVKPEVDYFCQLYNGEQIEIRGDIWENFSTTFQQDFIGGPILDSTEFDTHDGATEFCSTGACRKFVHRMFSVLSSTEENHKSDDRNFYGTFAHIRETLDYNYHENYTFERQKYQDAIISYFLHAAFITDKEGHICSTPTEPWIVFTAGAMGAGKSYTMRHLMERGRFPLVAFVNVDPDEIRRHLPEYRIYVDQCPELAGELTRKEAGYISELMTLAAIQAGKNVMVDGSLRDATWYQTYFKRLRQDYPFLRLAIIHVTAPREAVFQRAADRAKTTGRVVPEEMLTLALEQVPRSIATLRPLVDYFVELNNAPDTDDIELVTEGETWEHFQSNWIQFCAWLPHTRKKVTRF